METNTENKIINKFPREPPPDINPAEDELLFQVIDWYIPEADRAADHYRRLEGYPPQEGSPEVYKIFMYGVTKTGNSVCAQINNFCPYFFLKIPPAWDNLTDKQIKENVKILERTLKYEQTTKRKFNKSTREWEEYTANIIPYKLRDHLEYVKIVKRKNFWYFTNGQEFPFIKIRVKSLALFNILKRHFGEPAQIDAGFAMYESNIDPFLRFIHERNIEPCGWVKLPRDCYDFIEDGEDGPISRANYNVAIDYTDVYACNINQIAPLLVVSFDIECTSSHGDFPVAKKNYKKLAADLLSTARTYKKPSDITQEQVTTWILDAFEKPTQITLEITINQVFPKEHLKREILARLVGRNIAQITDLLKTAIVNAKGIAEDDSDDDADDAADGDVPKKTAAAKKKEDTTNEENLIKFLDKNLPEICGDSVIQIGTTVNRYGSDEIIYKHIVTLKSCKSIPGVDVESFDTEEEVLNAWKEVIARLDPDILIGYNIFGFDMQYIWQRAEELCIDEEFAVGLGRMNNRRTILDKKELSSSALGDNIMYMFDMDGVVLIDLLKVMQRDHKLDSYKLDAVAKHFLKDSKEDLKPRELFEKFLGSAQDRCDIATYCIQDCALCNRLMHKLKVLENNVGMGNVCSVPLSYLFMRGQGIKIFSLVAKECRAKQYLIPVVKSTSTYSYATKEKIEGAADDAPPEEDGYEGAIVLPPQEGMYLEDPITVLDYSSLYPSSMISRNLSHDSYVPDLNSPYAHLESEGITYHKITYDVYEGKGDAKHAVGKKECTFAQFPNGKKGIIPSILMKLLTQRKTTRKKIEYETLTLKNGNIVIGLVKESDDGVKFSVTDVDAGETQTIDAADVVSRADTFNPFEKAVLDALQIAYKLTANSLYGQIGSKMSAIYLKEIAACTTATGREMIMTAKGFVERQYNAEVIYGDSVMPETPLLIRHRQTGTVVIKEIASLADETMWQEYAIFKQSDGSNHQSNRTEKQQALASNYEIWTDRGWSSIIRVIRHKCNKRIYRVVDSNGVVDVTEDHSLLDMNRNLVKPEQLLERPEAKEHSVDLLHRIPTPVDLEELEYLKFPLPLRTAPKDNDPQIYELGESNAVIAQQKYMYLASNGFHVKVDYLYGSHHIYYSNCPFEHSKKYVYTRLQNYNGFVYDIETDEGVFQAGVGSLIVKNTDSIFCKFPVINKETGERVYGREALPLCIEAGQKASKEIKAILPPPQCLEYEKTMWPFILLSKKRYVGNLYETDANKKPKQKSMGIVLKRRDNANIVKIIYGGIIDILLNNNDFEGSVKFLKDELQKMVDGNVDLINLIVSKTLKGNYKDPTKIAHRVLASRMGERDEGNMPMVNDRVPYIYIKSADGSVPKLQGDRIEHPDYIREMNLRPDYLFYITNQLIKPISQLYALCVDQLPGYSYPPSYWLQWDEELCGKELYTNDKKRKDRIQALKMKEVESLLFYPYMVQIDPDLLKTKSRATSGPRGAKKTKKSAGASGGADGDDESEEELINSDLAENSKTLEIRVKQLKAGKKPQYEATITIADCNAKPKAPPLKELKLELTGIKHVVLTQATEKGFQLLTKEFPELKGVPVQIRIDKTFIKTLKKAFQEADSIQETLKKAIAEQDMAKLVELQQLQQTANILGYYQNNPFVFDPI
jgi:DNA polymerase elongation subunit (family B)